jgi:hypothetical protein
MSPVITVEADVTRGEATLSPQVPSDVLALLGQGAAVVVATSDASMRPHVARAWAPEMLDEHGPMRLCVTAPAGSAMAYTLEEDQEIAVTVARPSTYRSVQMKGVVVDVRPPDQDQMRLVDEHSEAFVEDVERVGVSPRLVRRLLDRSALVSVTFELEELYDQTPGPAAGRSL